MEDKEFQEYKDKIDKMTQREMAQLLKFAPVGHQMFDRSLPLFDYFKKRFKELKGMTPAISKSIGWE